VKSSPPQPPATSSARSRPWRLALALAAYNLLLVILSPALVGWLLWRTVVQRKGSGNLLHRLGYVPRPPRQARPRVWLHAVSAGEMAAMKPVSDSLRQRLPGAYLAISTLTATGMSVGEKSCRSADALFYLPFDLAPTALLALWRLRPALVVVAEKELWPNLLGLARLMGAVVVVVNGRVSDRMMRRAGLAPHLVRWLYSLPHHYCVQSEQDAARLVELGVPPACVTVAGNTKVDTMAARDREAEERLRRNLGVSEHDVWLVAGSTHPGEEEAVAEAFAVIRKAIPGARLLLAPRHLERAGAVSEMLAQRGHDHVLRSACSSAGFRPAAVLLDTMGELRAAYGLATLGFVGGTLVSVGGHNLLEPVAAGRAVLFGPHTHNCADVADLVLSAGVGFRVASAGELAERFLRIAKDPDLQQEVARRGQALIECQRGAAGRCVEVATRLLKERTA